MLHILHIHILHIYIYTTLFSPLATLSLFLHHLLNEVLAWMKAGRWDSAQDLLRGNGVLDLHVQLTLSPSFRPGSIHVPSQLWMCVSLNNYFEMQNQYCTIKTIGMTQPEVQFTLPDFGNSPHLLQPDHHPLPQHPVHTALCICCWGITISTLKHLTKLLFS